jgi:hypothetical protein
MVLRPKLHLICDNLSYSSEIVPLIFLCDRYECELDLYAERQRGTKNAFNIFMTLKVLCNIFRNGAADILFF